MLLQGFGLLACLGNKLKVDLERGEFGKRSRSKSMRKVFGLSNKHLNNLLGRASTYISLSNPFCFCYLFSHTSCLLSVFEQKICTCVIQICLIPCFVLLARFFLIFVLLSGLGQEAQQVMCGAIGLGQQAYLSNLLKIFSMHLIL